MASLPREPSLPTRALTEPSISDDGAPGSHQRGQLARVLPTTTATTLLHLRARRGALIDTNV